MVLRQTSVNENKENRIGNTANHHQYVQSDEQSSVDSTETKPKLAKLLTEKNLENKVNATMPNLRANDHTPISKTMSLTPASREVSHSLVQSNNQTAQTSSDSEKNFIMKSQSFPQHSAPPKKCKFTILFFITIYLIAVSFINSFHILYGLFFVVQLLC